MATSNRHSHSTLFPTNPTWERCQGIQELLRLLQRTIEGRFQVISRSWCLNFGHSHQFLRKDWGRSWVLRCLCQATFRYFKTNRWWTSWKGLRWSHYWLFGLLDGSRYRLPPCLLRSPLRCLRCHPNLHWIWQGRGWIRRVIILLDFNKEIYY